MRFVVNPNISQLNHRNYGYVAADGYDFDIAIPPEHQGRVLGLVSEYLRGPYQNAWNFSIRNWLDATAAPGGGYAIAGNSPRAIVVAYDSHTLLVTNGYPYYDEFGAQTINDAVADTVSYYQLDWLTMAQYAPTEIRLGSSNTLQYWGGEEYEDRGYLRGVVVRGGGITTSLQYRVLGYLVLNGEPQAPQADYCGVVQPGFGSPGEGGGIDLGIGLPVIAKGQALCSGIGALEADLPVVGVIEFPGISICFEPITFGVLQLFGIGINLDLMVFVMGAVMVLRWFLRS